MASPSSSERTNEDPTAPDSIAATATVTVTPENAEAKLAFSQVVDWILEQAKDPTGVDARAHARRYIWWQSDQRPDADVSRLLRHRNDLPSSSPASSFSTEVPTTTTTQKAPTATPVPDVATWSGCYFIDLAVPPARPARGWSAGRLRQDEPYSDFVLSLGRDVKQHHAYVNIDAVTGRVKIRKSGADGAKVEVNGQPLLDTTQRVLNDVTTRIRFGQLAYDVQYARFSQTSQHTQVVQRYLRRFDSGGSMSDMSLAALTPIPSSSAAVLSVGQWHLSETGTVGVGGAGRVSIGVNQAGKVVALKRLSIDTIHQKLRVKRQQRNMERLTNLANEAGQHRIVRLLESISDTKEASKGSVDLWFVLEPAVPRDLSEMGSQVTKGPNGMKRIRDLITEVLMALDFLHINLWIHGDIKPPNIGIRHWDDNGASIVLLDIDDAIYAPTARVRATPGAGGTVGFLSPEREMTSFDATTDVWALGVVALWLLGQGKMPFDTRKGNPWRPDEPTDRGDFHTRYKDAITFARTFPDILEDAIVRMLRHPYAQESTQRQQRPSSVEVLQLFGKEGSGPSDRPAKRNKPGV